MKPHVKNFLKSRRLTGYEPHLCEWCLDAVMVDVHHVVMRSLGGGDEATNTIGLCRPCHEAAHRNELSVRELLERVELVLSITKAGDFK